MTPLLIPSVAASFCLLLVGCGSTGPRAGSSSALVSDHLAVDAPQAQRFGELGAHGRQISTSSAAAQGFFDQGLAWMYSFNHDEAIRSFAKAAELDPGCAMPWWGIAVCEGPNYNDALMTDERSAAAHAAMLAALARLEGASPLERELILTLEERYSDPWPEDRSALNEAYAGALGELFSRHRGDPDIGTLYAESLMVLRPWKLYDQEGAPEEGTAEITSTLEAVLEAHPGNPGANHLYIHAVEPSADPGRALAAADRLRELVPISGHMNHMPSHIYVQTGDWDKSIEQNRAAMLRDERYLELSPEQGIQRMYIAHNAHMLAFSAMMAGREAEAMQAARKLWSGIPAESLPGVAPFIDLWMTSAYDVQKRFGRWDALLAEPAPPDCLPITTAVWRAHRAIAHAAKGDIPMAEAEYALFGEARDRIPEDSVFSGDPSRRILAVSDAFVAGEIALQQGQWELARQELEAGVAVEDSLGYGEPPQWLQPTRHTLGAVHLAAGEPEEAERVYRDDLARWPGNGWSLLGLAQALTAQGRTDEAAGVMAQHRAAWARADAELSSSCLCLPGA